MPLTENNLDTHQWYHLSDFARTFQTTIVYNERSKLSMLKSRSNSSKINPFDAKANMGIFYETLKTGVKLIKVLKL